MPKEVGYNPGELNTNLRLFSNVCVRAVDNKLVRHQVPAEPLINEAYNCLQATNPDLTRTQSTSTQEPRYYMPSLSNDCLRRSGVRF